MTGFMAIFSVLGFIAQWMIGPVLIIVLIIYLVTQRERRGLWVTGIILTVLSVIFQISSIIAWDSQFPGLYSNSANIVQLGQPLVVLIFSLIVLIFFRPRRPLKPDFQSQINQPVNPPAQIKPRQSKVFWVISIIVGAIIILVGGAYIMLLAIASDSNASPAYLLMPLAGFVITITGIVYVSKPADQNGPPPKIAKLLIIVLMAAAIFTPFILIQLERNQERQEKIDSGVIGGITKEQAINIAQQKLDNQYQYRLVGSELHEKEALWWIVFNFYKPDGLEGSHYFNIDAKSGAIESEWVN